MQSYFELITLLQMLITALSGGGAQTNSVPTTPVPPDSVVEEVVAVTQPDNENQVTSEDSNHVSAGIEESEPVSSSSCELPALTFDESDFDHVFDGTETTKTVTLQGHQWDNTLIKNCYVHDTNGDGIVLRDVSNVVITGCTFENIGGQAAVRGSISGSTDGVTLYNNTVHNVAQNGFNFGQRITDGVDHTNLRIIGNTIDDTGVLVSGGLAHALYIQAQDAEITHNTITGSRDGNGISVRSSGEVACNDVSGTSQSGKPGIRYYSDHQTGPNETLTIDHNTVTGANIGIDIFEPVNRYDGQSGYAHVVKTFVITDNTISANTTPLRVDQAYSVAPFTVTIQGNN